MATETPTFGTPLLNASKCENSVFQSSARSSVVDPDLESLTYDKGGESVNQVVQIERPSVVRSSIHSFPIVAE